MAITISGTNGIVGAGFTVDNSGVSVTAGVGTFGTLAAPAAGLTGALPALSAASLTSIPAANIVGVCTSGLTKTGGFGKILQVVSSTTTSTVSSADVGPVDTGLSGSITPSATSSKILVIVSQSMMVRRTGGNGWSVINWDLVRDSTVIIDGVDNIAHRGDSHSPYTLIAGQFNFTFLDSPNTTSSTTYKTQAGRGPSGDSDMNWKAQDNSSPSIITLLEVAQ